MLPFSAILSRMKWLDEQRSSSVSSSIVVPENRMLISRGCHRSYFTVQNKEVEKRRKSPNYIRKNPRLYVLREIYRDFAGVE